MSRPIIKSSNSLFSSMKTSISFSVSKIFAFIVIKPLVFLTPLTVFKKVILLSSLFPIIFTNFAFRMEICDPESYVPFISILSSNNTFILINGVVTRFFVHLVLLLLLNYFLWCL